MDASVDELLTMPTDALVREITRLRLENALLREQGAATVEYVTHGELEAVLKSLDDRYAPR